MKPRNYSQHIKGSTLSMPKMGLSGVDLGPLIEFLNNNPTITSLDLSNNKIGGPGLLLLFTGCKYITALNVQGNAFKPVDLKKAIDSTPKSPIYIVNGQKVKQSAPTPAVNNIEPEPVAPNPLPTPTTSAPKQATISTAKQPSPYDQFVSGNKFAMVSKGISGKNVDAIIQYLNANPQIKELDLSRNIIGGPALLRLFTGCQHITVLNVQGNAFKPIDLKNAISSTPQSSIYIVNGQKTKEPIPTHINTAATQPLPPASAQTKQTKKKLVAKPITVEATTIVTVHQRLAAQAHRVKKKIAAKPMTVAKEETLMAHERQATPRKPIAMQATHHFAPSNQPHVLAKDASAPLPEKISEEYVSNLHKEMAGELKALLKDYEATETSNFSPTDLVKRGAIQDKITRILSVADPVILHEFANAPIDQLVQILILTPNEQQRTFQEEMVKVIDSKQFPELLSKLVAHANEWAEEGEPQEEIYVALPKATLQTKEKAEELYRSLVIMNASALLGADVNDEVSMEENTKKISAYKEELTGIINENPLIMQYFSEDDIEMVIKLINDYVYDENQQAYITVYAEQIKNKDIFHRFLDGIKETEGFDRNNLQRNFNKENRSNPTNEATKNDKPSPLPTTNMPPKKVSEQNMKAKHGHKLFSPAKEILREKQIADKIQNFMDELLHKIQPRRKRE